MAKPWVHHKNSSATSLSRLGLEKAVAPVQSVTPPASDYQRKILPPIPNTSGQSNLRRPLSDQSPGGSDPKGKNIIYPERISRVDGISRPPIGSKSHYLPESVYRLTHSTNRKLSGDRAKKVLPPPPPPPMSQSARKILQLTGFDPSFDQEPKSHYSVSPESSDSSGSQYSQHESEPEEYIPPQSQWTAVTAGDPSAAYQQSSFYSAIERSASISDMSVAAVAAASASATSLRVRDRPAKQNKQGIDLAGEDSADNLTNEEFMAVEMARNAQQKRTRFDDGFEHDTGSRYGHELTDAARRDLVPRPLAIRPKWMVNIEDEKLDRHYTNPHSPTGFPYDGMPVCSRMTPPPAQRPTNRRKFGTGKYPIKSPFPFSSQKDSEAGEPEQRFRKKFAGAMKRLSGGRKLPVKQTVITNEQREAGGPDTPLPSNSGFKSFLPSPDRLQKGNEHLQYAVDKAKKSLKIKTADEKRREDLKKQIVVVGVTDQSPGISPKPFQMKEADDFRDGRVSEWL